jgi:hypothetical protein
VIRMERQSRLSTNQVIEEARAFFGPGGLGLEVIELAECCARFAGGGGEVYVQAFARQRGTDEKPAGSRVEIEGREWDYQIRQFLGQI